MREIFGTSASRRFLLPHCGVILLLIAPWANAASPTLQLIISNETIPAGATGQIKVWAAFPMPVASGGFYVYFDPKVFSGIAGAGAFSANGDVTAQATIAGPALGVTFSSILKGSPVSPPVSGIGRLPDLPIFTIDVTVAAGVLSGTKTSIGLDVSAQNWLEAYDGSAYTVAVVPGSVTVGGNLSIAKVEPGGGLVPAGAAVKVSGTGFDPSATLAVEGVSLSGSKFVSAEEIDFILGAPAEMTGKRVVVTNPDGSHAEYFPVLAGVGPDGTLYVFPLATGSIVTGGAENFILQNPGSSPVEVSVTTSFEGMGAGGTYTNSLDPGQVFVTTGPKFVQTDITASGPLRDRSGEFSGLLSVPITAPPFVNFAAASGSAAALSQTVPVYIDSPEPLGPPELTVTTEAGGNWLSVSQTPMQNGIQLLITANPAGLGAGYYVGTIVIPASGEFTTGSATIVVLLNVGGVTGQLVASPPSLEITSSAGAQPTGVEVNVDAGSASNPAPNQVQASTSDGGNWLSVGPGTALQFSVTANATNLSPGTYSGSILVNSPSQSLTIPVTLNVPLENGPPSVGSVVNAASAASAGLAPGEIVTIYGTQLGPSAPASSTLDAKGDLSTTLAETSVLFGKAPAALLYVSSTQINAIVPASVGAQPYAMVQVQTPAGTSTPIGVPVVPANPGIFTLSGTGQGAAAVLNQDNSVNGPSHAAAPGSVVQIYGTGSGLVQGAEGSPVLPIQVFIGGVEATVLYAGPAPGEVSGVLQVNAMVPQTVSPGMLVPVVLSVGGAESPSRATIAVQ